MCPAYQGTALLPSVFTMAFMCSSKCKMQAAKPALLRYVVLWLLLLLFRLSCRSAAVCHLPQSLGAHQFAVCNNAFATLCYVAAGFTAYRAPLQVGCGSSLQ
jgi:hypothetical protein